MDLSREVADKIARFTAGSELNRHPDGSGPYFEEPLVGFADAGDSLFADYKAVIGAFHWTPAEAFDAVHGAGAFAGGSVIVWVLPVSRATRRSNRGQERLPSPAWALTRQHGEAFNAALRRRVVEWLGARGHRAAAPLLAPGWRMVDDARVGLASTWSERHAAYAAGLGTFSLNDGLITPRGIAHRLGSVVVEAALPPSPRPYPERRHNCLFHREGTCGACIRRCPVGALSEAGHDKARCREHVYGAAVGEVGERHGLAEVGCGLCQTGVPCEDRIPAGSKG